MCKLDSKQIIDDFDKHLQSSGKRYYSEFYIGVSKDAASRMFNQHNVNKDNSWWIFRTANNSDEARKVESYFISKGMRGGKGGGDNTAVQVYCYAVSPTTIE